jgi:transposase-like protein
MEEKEFGRWTAGRKTEIVLDILRGQIALTEFCRANDLTQGEVQGWIDNFISGGKQNLKVNAKEQKSEYEKQIRQLREKVGELVVELEVRKNLQAWS